MTAIKISGNFSALTVQIQGLQNFTRQSINKSLTESANIIKKGLRAEMQKPKTGVLKPKSRMRRGSPLRRSAIGEGLANDTGYAMSLIANTMASGNKIYVGFKKPYLFDYIKYWEGNGRPTLSNVKFEKTQEVYEAFCRNLKTRF
jgi:hypothetical protein